MTSKINRFGVTVALAGSVLVVSIFSLPSIILADNINPGLFSVDSKPYGLSFADWSVKWWQWLIPVPTPVNPAADKTGKDCAMNQPARDVWFLAQTTSGPGERTCTIPAGRAIVLPVAINECSKAEDPSLTTESALRACAVSGNDVSSIVALVDGVKLTNLGNYRVQSPLFNFVFPDNNIFGAPAGPTQAVSDAYLVFLKPLSPGNHTLEFSQVTLDNPTTGTKSFAYSIRYHLVVNP
jgi:hypothetical protein